MALDYKETLDKKNNQKVLNVISEMPYYARDFFNHIYSDASRTRLAYAYHIRTFYNWLLESNAELKDCQMKDISLEILDQLDISDIDEFLAYMSTRMSPAGLAQKTAALSTFFKYLYSNNKIKSNPVSGVKRNKIEQQQIVKLTDEEISRILDVIEYGAPEMSAKQKAYWERDKWRNLAIVVLLLSTGIRVSECAGLDLSDIDLENCSIDIKRKGHRERQSVYFSDEAKEYLEMYLSERNIKTAKNGSESAVFLSDRGSRMSVQAIEDNIKKITTYAKINKHITPHKLRKTYGTNLYNQTGDIYLVASALGQKDVATTTKHYVESDMERLRKSRNVVRIKK